MRSDVIAGALILTAAAVVAGWLVARDYQSVRASLREQPVIRDDAPASPLPLASVPTTQETEGSDASRFSAAPQRSFRGGRSGTRRGRGFSTRQSSAAPIRSNSHLTSVFS
jgi:hypothetical protein